MSSTTFYLYPQLPKPIAEQRVQFLVTKSVEELAHEWALSDPACTFTPTGGNRIPDKELQTLRERVVAIAHRFDYPHPPRKKDTRSSFDLECAKILYQTMQLHPSEASRNDVWSFLGCVLLPDIVRWRFADGEPMERFIGNERGLRRHTFGRLWWRAYLTFTDKSENPYQILHYMNEDELVQVTERPVIAVRPALFRAFCIAFIVTVEQHKPTVTRRDLIREGSKRLLRLLSLVSVEALSDREVQELTRQVFTDTVTALERTDTATQA